MFLQEIILLSLRHFLIKKAFNQEQEQCTSRNSKCTLQLWNIACVRIVPIVQINKGLPFGCCSFTFLFTFTFKHNRHGFLSLSRFALIKTSRENEMLTSHCNRYIFRIIARKMVSSKSRSGNYDFFCDDVFKTSRHTFCLGLFISCLLLSDTHGRDFPNKESKLPRDWTFNLHV